MKVEEGLDTGPVYARRVVPIGDDIDLAALRDELVEAGSALLVASLAGGVAGLPTPEPAGGRAHHRPQADARGPAACSGSEPAAQLHRVVRLGRAWTTFRGRRLGILQATRPPVGAGAGAGGGPGAHRGRWWEPW